MFGLSSLELRLAFYGVLLAAISGWLIYERVHLIDEGEARIKAQDATARAEQKAEDEKTSAGVIDELKTDNQNLRALATKPAPTLRLCVPTRYVRAAPAPSGAQPSVAPASGESGSGVPPGVTELDIGPAMSDLAFAASAVSVYRDRTWEWAVKQAK